MERVESPADTTSDSAIEREIKAKGLTAPRVTPADIEAASRHIEIHKFVSSSGQVLRWAIITTPSGFAVVGAPSVAVSRENDDEVIGTRVAIENSKQALWPLLGYALKERLHAQREAGIDVAPQDYRDRVRAERTRVYADLEKLMRFTGTIAFSELPDDQRHPMLDQRDAMQDYVEALDRRIAAFPA